jgi:hypothetical protein
MPPHGDGCPTEFAQTVVNGRIKPAIGNAGYGQAERSRFCGKDEDWLGGRSGSESSRHERAVCRILDRKMSSAADLILLFSPNENRYDAQCRGVDDPALLYSDGRAGRESEG